MQILQQYADEIEQICDGGVDMPAGAPVYKLIRAHWQEPKMYGGLFVRCQPLSASIYSTSTGFCGCLTQIRGFPRAYRVVAPAFGRELAEALTAEIVADERLARSPDSILPDHLQDLRYPLTDEQKQEVRQCLYPYAEWQTRLRREFKDAEGAPVVEVELVEEQ